MGSRTLQAETTAEAYLELLKDRGIDVFLGNAGTDFASLVEAFARFESAGGRAPRPMVVPHEFVAVSMAHGYYVAGGRPAAVMVHVNVGTGNASTAIITAARANVPIFMSAGRTPLTEAGLPGARAVAGLVAVAEAGGIGVVEADPIYLNVSHRHDLHLGYNQSGTTNPSLGEADAVLVVEADVPWYPHLKKPVPGAPIIHLGVDPFFSRYPVRSYPCDVPIAATPAVALPMLAEAVRRHADPQAVARRRARVRAEHPARHAAGDETAAKPARASTNGLAGASRGTSRLTHHSP